MAATDHTPGTSEGNAVDVDVSWLVRPDLTVIHVLTRMHVAARRCGRPLWLHGATTELVELLELVGLRQIVHVCSSTGGSGDHCGRKPPS
jgi:ABC-type transporter Mla MlaB component